MISKEQMADMNPATLRIIERLEKDWVVRRMKELKVGDIFRFQDRNVIEYVAKELPFVNDFYVWTIDAELRDVNE
jgi:hypothetical protein